MTTNNAVNNGLSGATGSGLFVGQTSPTLITPTLGVATGTSLAFSPTTGGIIGTTTNNNAGAGFVGEFVSSVIASGSPVNLPNAAPTNVTSISLTAGDWDVFGNVSITPAGGSVVTNFVVWISSTSATLPDPSLYNFINLNAAAGSGGLGLSAPSLRFSLSTTTTIYLSADQASSAPSTATASGGIYARRRR